MILYEKTKDMFLEDVYRSRIVNEIRSCFFLKLGYSNINPAEENAWRNSMQYMYNILKTDTIPGNCGVAIEFMIPNTSKRVDFILSGLDENNKNTAVIVELKQWQKVEIVSGLDAVVETFVGGDIREETHPSYQVWSYATTIEQYNEYVQDNNVALHPCAYLHNYEKVVPPTLLSPVYQEYLELAPAYVSDEADKLRDFISKYIKYGDNKETIYEIDNGRIRPSKALQDSLAGMLQGNREFIMIDDQKVVYETALDMARKSYKDGKKRVLVVEGGPGTGKSVVAVNLLVELTKIGMLAQYVTKNSAPRNVYAAKLTGVRKKTEISNMFKGSGSYVGCVENYFDALIVDEAHRLNLKSGMFKNKGENQIKEIISASKFSVFFIDENQRIDIFDIGSVEEILYHAKRSVNNEKTDIKKLKLNSQFRCNGSDGYISWLDDVLDIRRTANFDGFDFNYDIQICDDPNQVMNKIYNKNLINNKARVLAGYCWNWVSKNDPNGASFDIEFSEFNFRKKWNFNTKQTWAIDPTTVDEIGCIHTSQGLEFDYAGVIIGNDLKYRNGRIVTDFTERAGTDKSLSGIIGINRTDPNRAKEIADEIIKNTYKTLMSRGQKGCYVFCADKELSDYLKNRLKATGRPVYLDDISEELPDKIKKDIQNAEWDVKDVMIGVLRNKEQLATCLNNKFYHIPCSQLSPDDALNIKTVALYQSKTYFGQNAGVKYYGEVDDFKVVKRNMIKEIPSSRTDAYYLFKIKNWEERPVMLKATENIPKVTFFTNSFLLEHALDTGALTITSEEEFIEYYKRKTGK